MGAHRLTLPTSLLPPDEGEVIRAITQDQSNPLDFGRSATCTVVG